MSRFLTFCEIRQTAQSYLNSKISIFWKFTIFKHGSLLPKVYIISSFYHLLRPHLRCISRWYLGRQKIRSWYTFGSRQKHFHIHHHSYRWSLRFLHPLDLLNLCILLRKWLRRLHLRHFILDLHSCLHCRCCCLHQIQVPTLRNNWQTMDQ